MAERSEEARVAGLLEVRLGGVLKRMPTLKAKYVPEWFDRLYGAGISGKPLTDYSIVDVAKFAAATVTAMVDLVVAYDRTAALGGREWIEENADPVELHEALVQMTEATSPLADAATTVALALSALAASSVRPSSPSGASTNGAKTPTKLRPRSIRSS